MGKDVLKIKVIECYQKQGDLIGPNRLLKISRNSKLKCFFKMSLLSCKVLGKSHPLHLRLSHVHTHKPGVNSNKGGASIRSHGSPQLLSQHKDYRTHHHTQLPTRVLKSWTEILTHKHVQTAIILSTAPSPQPWIKIQVLNVFKDS